MKVTLVRRWGPHRAGQSVEVDAVQGAWLIQHSYAASAGDVQAPAQPAVAEGAHGADPLAGGDATRRRPRVPRSQGSTAVQAAGSSPTYRAGFDAEAAKRQGPAGRPAPEPAPAAEGPADDSKKPAKRRSKSEA